MKWSLDIGRHIRVSQFQIRDEYLTRYIQPFPYRYQCQGYFLEHKYDTAIF